MRNLLKVIAPVQSQRFFHNCIREFFRAKCVRGGIYAIDSTEILVGEAKTFEGAGTISDCASQGWEHHLRGQDRLQTNLLNLKPDREIVVSYRLVPLNTNALQVVREMVAETLDLGGAGAIGLLLIVPLLGAPPKMSFRRAAGLSPP